MTEAMEVRKGYKQTEVGVIPEDWEVKSISSFADIATGNTPPTRDLNNYGDEFLFVGPADLGKRKWILNSEKKLSRIGFNISRKFPPNSVLFTCIGSTIGKSGMATVELTSNQQINAILPNENFHCDFLYYALNLLSPKIKALAGEQAVPLVNKTQFGETLVALPATKSEQAAIATALSDADALITSLEKLIEKKRAIKQGAMQKCLNPDSCDLSDDPDFKPHQRNQTNQKNHSSDKWEVKKLGECLKTNPDYGINAAAVPFNDTLPTYLRITDISDDGYYVNQDKVSVNHVQADSFYLEESDIVFARTGASVGKSYLYDKNDGKLVFAGFLIRLRPDQEILNSAYLKYITQTKNYWNWVNTNSMRSGQPGLNSNEYKSFEVSLPSIEEQTRIATILSDMDAEIAALEQKLGKYKFIKQGMMQELLTGKIRLI